MIVGKRDGQVRSGDEVNASLNRKFTRKLLNDKRARRLNEDWC